MVTQKVVVTDSSGLHLRPAGLLCEVCQKYQAKIQIKKGSTTVNAKSVINLLAARVQNGEEIEVICDGEDELEAMDEVIRAIEGGLVGTEV